MNFLTGEIIKHIKYRDVAFYVVKARYFGTTIKIKGHWINLGFDQCWTIQRANIVINRVLEKNNWLIATEPAAYTLRYIKWDKLKL